MTLSRLDALRTALYDPAQLAGWSAEQWDLLVRQARCSDLLARVGAAAQDHGCAQVVSGPPAMHIHSALLLVTRQQHELRREVALIEEALAPLGGSFVLLKGGAYVLAGLQAARGRLVSDVDILVAPSALPGVESALMMAGWVSTAKSDYDQRYYRTWMHELPPMQHLRRGTVIDVHHAILPSTARYHPSTDKLLASARPLQPGGRVQVLAPVDMVLHSATHLFHEGELELGLRGLVDVDRLLAEFSSAPEFWPALLARSQELGLSRPLFYALRYAACLLETPVPSETVQALARMPGASPKRGALVGMDALFLRALRPDHPSTSDRFTGLARWLLYVRSHWLRMPLGLLLRHLSRKLWQSGISQSRAG